MLWGSQVLLMQHHQQWQHVTVCIYTIFAEDNSTLKGMAVAKPLVRVQ